MEPTTHSNLFELKIDSHTSGYLAEAAKWARFLAILGFIVCGIFVLFTLFINAIITNSMAAVGGVNTYGPIIPPIGMLVGALLIFFPTLYLYRFSAKMRNAIQSKEQQVLDTSFSNLKSYFKFHGILAIIVLSFYTLIIIAGVVFMVASR